jgi:uncharacterized membrane protein YjgN (DUF898 family)
VGLPLALFLLPSALVTVVVGTLDEAAGDQTAIGVGLVFLLGLLLLPYFLFSIKRYQHGGYALGAMQAEFRSSAAAFYRVFGAAFGLWLLAVGLAVALFTWGVSDVRRSGLGLPTLLPLGLAALVFVAGYVLLIPYITARMQNLVWSRTGNRYFRFKSDLPVGAFIGLSLKNWLLMLCTLGLYYPWAAVAVRRLRLQAVTVHCRIPLDQLMARKVAVPDATGEAGADLAGIDFGV